MPRHKSRNDNARRHHDDTPKKRSREERTAGEEAGTHECGAKTRAKPRARMKAWGEAGMDKARMGKSASHPNTAANTAGIGGYVHPEDTLDKHEPGGGCGSRSVWSIFF
jgi:hypothetical protein